MHKICKALSSNISAITKKAVASDLSFSPRQEDSTLNRAEREKCCRSLMSTCLQQFCSVQKLPILQWRAAVAKLVTAMRK